MIDDIAIAWAGAQGWDAIEAAAYEDLPSIYAITGSAGRTFWTRLGFGVVETNVEPELEKDSFFVRQIRKEAKEAGLDMAAISRVYTMRREVGADA